MKYVVRSAETCIPYFDGNDGNAVVRLWVLRNRNTNCTSTVGIAMKLYWSSSTRCVRTVCVDHRRYLYTNTRIGVHEYVFSCIDDGSVGVRSWMLRSRYTNCANTAGIDMMMQ
jgi:hypothetical protein